MINILLIVVVTAVLKVTFIKVFVSSSETGSHRKCLNR